MNKRRHTRKIVARTTSDGKVFVREKGKLVPFHITLVGGDPTPLNPRKIRVVHNLR